MQVGCGTYLYAIIWGIGVIFTIGGFFVQPRDQAPAFFTIGVIGLILAAVVTYVKIIAPKREAEKKRQEELQKETKQESEEKAGNKKSHLMDIMKEKSTGFLIWIAIIAVCIIVVLIVTTDVGTWIAYIFGGLMIIYGILHFVYGSK